MSKRLLRGLAALVLTPVLWALGEALWLAGAAGSCYAAWFLLDRYSTGGEEGGKVQLVVCAGILGAIIFHVSIRSLKAAWRAMLDPGVVSKPLPDSLPWQTRK